MTREMFGKNVHRLSLLYAVKIFKDSLHDRKETYMHLKCTSNLIAKNRK